mmetsp:Transcript_141/g.1095  ORF Transcript_141/g.1095 Transcript_141/m.1095 type:complete len:204 (+) Transcript_141:1234-1845(+)
MRWGRRVEAEQHQICKLGRDGDCHFTRSPLLQGEGARTGSPHEAAFEAEVPSSTGDHQEHHDSARHKASIATRLSSTRFEEKEGVEGKQLICLPYMHFARLVVCCLPVHSVICWALPFLCFSSRLLWQSTVLGMLGCVLRAAAVAPVRLASSFATWEFLRHSLECRSWWWPVSCFGRCAVHTTASFCRRHVPLLLLDRSIRGR